jgi:hypothetical protein
MHRFAGVSGELRVAQLQSDFIPPFRTIPRTTMC